MSHGEVTPERQAYIDVGTRATAKVQPLLDLIIADPQNQTREAIAEIVDVFNLDQTPLEENYCADTFDATSNIRIHFNYDRKGNVKLTFDPNKDFGPRELKTMTVGEWRQRNLSPTSPSRP